MPIVFELEQFFSLVRVHNTTLLQLHITQNNVLYYYFLLDSAMEGVTEKPILDCCACGTAKYRLTFYGNWSEKSHPKDYPREYSTFFSCVRRPYMVFQRTLIILYSDFTHA